MNQGDAALEKKDIDGASAHYATAQRMVPDNVEMAFWAGVTLAGGGKYEAGLPMVKRAVATDPIYTELLQRIVDPPGLISKENAERLIKDAR